MSDPIEAALQKIKCGELDKLNSLYPEFSFE